MGEPEKEKLINSIAKMLDGKVSSETAMMLIDFSKRCLAKDSDLRREFDNKDLSEMTGEERQKLCKNIVATFNKR